MAAKLLHQHGWRERRVAVDLDTVFRTGGDQAVACRVTNISAAGCSADATLPIGARVEARLEGLGSVQAQVRWSIGGRSGLAFTDPGAEIGAGIAKLLAEARSASASIMWNDPPA